MLALTGEELLSWLDDTTIHWVSLIEAHPQILAFPCDVRETQTVGQLLQHIVAVELRYAERLAEQPETDYAAIPYSSVADIAKTHQQALNLLRPLLRRDDAFWNEAIEFATRSAGTMQAMRRTILVHLAMHAIRHYAQLATLVRQQDVKPDWAMDYLFLAAKPA